MIVRSCLSAWSSWVAGGFAGNGIACRLERDGVLISRFTRREVDLLAEMAPTGSPRGCALGMCLSRFWLWLAAVTQRCCETISSCGSDAQCSGGRAAGVRRQYQLRRGICQFRDPAIRSVCENSASLHGVMHLAREIMFTSEVKAPLAILRPTLIYGAADPHNGYGPNHFWRLARSREPIRLFGKGEERRDHVSIDDVAEVTTCVIYQRSAGALNIATGTGTSFREIAEMVLRISNWPVPIEEVPRTGPMPHNGYRAFGTTSCRAAFPDFSFGAASERIGRDGTTPRYDRDHLTAAAPQWPPLSI